MVSAYMCWGPGGWTYVLHEEGVALEAGRVPGAEPADREDMLAFLLRRRWPTLESGHCAVIGARPEGGGPPLAAAVLQRPSAVVPARQEARRDGALSERPVSVSGA